MTHEIIPFLGLRHPVSSSTHLVALVLSVAATSLLWRRARGHFRLQLAASCFGLSMVLQYAVSATYHALQLPWQELRLFLLLDLSAINVLIAASFTAPVLVLLRKGRRRDLCFAGVWLASALCIALKVMAHVGVLSYEPYRVSAVLYLGMGWLALAMIPDVLRAVGLRALLWAVCGLLAYALGLVMEWRGGPILAPGVFGSHELFHLCAIAGTFCHFIFIWNHVLAYALRGRIRLREPLIATATIPATSALTSANDHYDTELLGQCASRASAN